MVSRMPDPGGIGASGGIGELGGGVGGDAIFSTVVTNWEATNRVRINAK